MSTGDEVGSPATGHSTPAPPQMEGLALPCAPAADGPPTPVNVLRWVAAAKGEPWFPSRHAAQTGGDRDALDEPLAALRDAGLVRVEAWVRGQGQGYVLTPEGCEAVSTGAGVPASPSEAPAAAPQGPVASVADPKTSARLGLDPRPPLLVPLLLIANLVCFFVGLAGAVRGGYSVTTYLGRSYPYILHRLGAVTGEELLRGEWWRLFTSCFVHVGALHLVMNLLTLAIVGLLAELLWGRWRLAVIYLISGLAGGCAAMANQPASTLAGASGAILGLLGSQVAWLILFRKKLPPDVAADWRRTVAILLVLNVGVSLLPGISWEAHLGGGVAGFLAACLLHAIRFRTGWRRVAAALALLALPAACIGGLAAAVKWSPRWQEVRQRFVAKKEHEARQAQLSELERERQAAAERDEQILAYLKDVAHHLRRLAPQFVVPVEDRAKFQLVRTGERRKQAVAELRTEVSDLKASADAVVGHTDAPAASESLNQFRTRAREFAQARSKSLALLLKMLDAPGAPDAATWAEWNTSRQTADALWKALGQPSRW